MSKLTTLLILQIFLLVSCRTDKDFMTYPEYYREYRDVKYLIENNQLDVAISKFDSLIVSVPHIPSSNLFYVAKECAQREKCQLAAKYLKLSFINGKEYGIGHGKNQKIHNCKDQLADIFAKENKIHQSNFNLEYKKAIQLMIEEDQDARGGSQNLNAVTVDSLNMSKLLELIDKYGYPSEKLIGHSTAFDAFVILLHMDRDEENRIFKPILDKAYNDGYLWPRGLAWIVDRRRNWGPKKMEPYYYHMPSKKYDQFSKEHKLEIDRRRDSIGLEPK